MPKIATSDRLGSVVVEAIDYLMAKSRVLRKRHKLDCGRRLRLSEQQRWELAVLGRRLKPALRTCITIVRPETIMVW